MTHPSLLSQPIGRWLSLTVLLSCAVWGSTAAWADQDRRPVPMLKSYQAECAACHMAYPPNFLGRPAWTRIMGHLDRHFGVDASLDDATVQAISTWLLPHASTRSDAQNPAEDRITTSAWFVRKHRQFSAKDWANPLVGGAGNCMACHQAADRYGYDEDNVRLPSGVGSSRSWRWGGEHD